MNGVDLIRKERQRQRSRTGEHRSASWDDQHTRGQLAFAGAVYAVPPERRDQSILRLLWPENNWPYRPSDDRIHELTKAGALIAAEIDRLQRALAHGYVEGEA